jgi:hypothetical protein
MAAELANQFVEGRPLATKLWLKLVMSTVQSRFDFAMPMKKTR